MTTKWLRGLLVAVLFGAGAGPATAQTSAETQELVDRSAIAVRSLRADRAVGEGFESVLAGAKAVIVVPQLLKGGFIVGGEVGNGVMIARTADGGWGSPSFVRLAAASIGLQIGGSVSEVAFTIMTDKGLDAVLANQFKFGGDVQATLGPIGGQVEASTTTELGVDIFAYATSQGLFAGGAFEGAVIDQLENWNQTFYGSAGDPRKLVSDPVAAGPRADDLRSALQ